MQQAVRLDSEEEAGVLIEGRLERAIEEANVCWREWLCLDGRNRAARQARCVEAGWRHRHREPDAEADTIPAPESPSTLTGSPGGVVRVSSLRFQHESLRSEPQSAAA